MPHINEIVKATLDAALMYARDGVHVFPISSKTKRPLIKDWPNAATVDEGQIRKWWTERPAAMIGAATGQRSGFFALDIDAKPGKDGFASLAALEARHTPLPATFRAKTPSGGEHCYFRYPDGVTIRSRAGDIAPGLDTRGGRADGSSAGYVNLPPSTRDDGKSYRPINGCDLLWEIGAQLPDAPEWLLFLAIFSRRQRDQLATIGVTSAGAFNGAQPRQWTCLADDALTQAWGGAQAAPGQPLDTNSADAVVNYISSAINAEIAAIPEAGNGVQESTINRAGLAIHSLICGARLRGVEAKALADIEASTCKRYCDAVVSMQSFKSGEPWTKQDAEAKWRHTQEDAEHRNLWHVGAASDADSDFAGIDLTLSADTNSVLEFASDISLAAIIARQSNALVKGLLHPGETAMLYGASGAGKSFIALDLAWHIATGREWHGRRVTQSSVLYVCLEGVDGFRKRMLTNQGELGDPGKFFARLALHVSLVKAEAGKQGADAVVGAVKKLTEEAGAPTRLVVIDTLARAMAGDDENATGEMTAFVERRAGYIARATGAAVLIIHHTNATGTVRGNGSLWAACETVMRATRDGESRMLAAEKVKDGVEGPLFNYNLELVPLGTDADGDGITSCIVRSTAIDTPTPAAKPQKVAKHVKTFIEAFEAAMAAGHAIERPSDIEGFPTLSQVDLVAIHREFVARYVTGAGDLKTARETKERQWRLALKDVLAEFHIEVVAGVERAWRPLARLSHPGYRLVGRFVPLERRCRWAAGYRCR